VERSPAAWIENSRQYLGEVRSELRKVTWPTQKEYVGGTIATLVIVAIITTVLGLMDMSLARVMQWLVP
jgi:preprotein translocase subunit SecE